MSDKKISALTALATIADGDLIPTVDISDTTQAASGTTKKVTVANLLIGKANATHVHAGADITTGTVATARLGTGSATSSNFLRGDNTWATPSIAAALLIANNLSDLASVATAKTNLGLGTAANSNTGDFAATAHTHAAADVTSGTMATARLGSGTASSGNFLRGDSTWVAVTSSGGDMLAANNLSDVANAATSRTNLGLGTIATQSAASVAVTGGSIAGITDLAVADGGTGASTAADARTNLAVTTTGADTTYAFRSNNLSDLASAATARTNLGLGTGNSPTFAGLNIPDGTIAVTRTGGAVAQIYVDSGDVLQLDTNTQIFIGANASGGNLTLQSGTGGAYTNFKVNGGTEAVRFTDAGNVGIGTATPTQKLDVAGTVKVTTLMFGDATTMTTATSGSHTHPAADIVSGTMATARLGSGTATSGNFLRGDSTWANISGGGDMLAANNLADLTSIVTAKANLSITPSDVGLGNVANALQLTAANNLADLANIATAKANLSIAPSDVGLGNVANALQLTAANNLADLASIVTAKANLSIAPSDVGLGNVSNALQLTAANNFADVTNVATAKANLSFVPSDVSLGNVVNALQLQAANNLSDVTNATTARTNLGLGTIATQNAATVAITGGAINGATVGATTPATGAFTSLSTTGNVNVAAGSQYLYGGYPVIIAQTALNNRYFGGAGNLSGTGTANTAIGYNSLTLNTSGSSNTACGDMALRDNTSGQANTASGRGSLASNTTGSQNTAVGELAIATATTGSSNTSVGYRSLFLNTTGSENAAIGVTTLYSNTTGTYNTASGYNSLYSNTTGSLNTANGGNALSSNTTGGSNTAVGVEALFPNTTGANNTAIGVTTLRFNSTGSENVACGVASLYSNTTGNYNSAFGRSGLQSNTTGSENATSGNFSLYSNTTGAGNVAHGYESGRYTTSSSNTTGSYSVFLGYDTRAAADGETNQIVIGSIAIGNGSNSVTLGNSSITKTVLRGNVGFGTVSPSATLDVVGTAKINGLSIGYLNIPQVGSTKTASYSLVVGDIGKFIELGTGGTIVVPASVFAAGDVVSMVNNTSATIACTCSAITTVYKGGTNTNISSTGFSITTRGMATLFFVNATTAVVTGNIA